MDVQALGNKIGDLSLKALGLGEVLFKISRPFAWLTGEISKLIAP